MNDPVTLVRHLSRRAIEVDEAQTLLDEMNLAVMNALGADRARWRMTGPGIWS